MICTTYTLTKQEKDEILQHIKIVLLEHDEIVFAYAHGSFVADHPFRDCDIAVYFRDKNRSLKAWIYEDSLSQKIVHRLHLPFPVDLRILNLCSVTFQFHVIQGKLLVDREPELRLTLIEYFLSRYLDIKPVLDHHIKEVVGYGSQ